MVSAVELSLSLLYKPAFMEKWFCLFVCFKLAGGGPISSQGN